MRGKAPVSRFKNAPEFGYGRLGAFPRPGRVAAPAAEQPSRLMCPLLRGPYQNNGATPWYAELPLGTPGQTLKIALDTGSNFIWTRSSLFTGGCRRTGKGQFVYDQSRTFAWVDQADQKVSFGPWGNMIVELGGDDIGLLPECPLRSPFYLAKYYSGEQFAELDWEAGIGFPSGSDFADPGIPLIVAELMNLGFADPEYPYLSFGADAAAGKGLCRIGGVDPGAFDPRSGIFMRWSPYMTLPGVQYIWSTALNQYWVGDALVASNAMFCLDSGSSQFKGDDGIMNETLRRVSGPNQPDVRLTLGATGDGGVGEITVPPSVYMVEIQAGPEQGQVLPQFNPLGVADLVLVGSVLMDHLYTVFEYDVAQTPAGYHLAPVGMWLFNRPGGPELIRSRSKHPASVGARKPVHTP